MPSRSGHVVHWALNCQLLYCTLYYIVGLSRHFVNKCAVARFCFHDDAWTKNRPNVATTNSMNRRSWCEDVLIFPVPLYTIYRGTSFMRLLVLSVLTCSPNMSFLAQLVSDNFRGVENWSWGHCPPRHPKEKYFCITLRSCSWISARQTWPS